MNKNKKYLTLLLYIFLAAGITSLPVNSAIVKPANSQYSNNLLGINLQKLNEGNVRVNIITAKPYKIKLLPIQRRLNEYLIFLPETFHSITSKPDFSNFENIKDLEVSLVPNLDSNLNNGYTKITIKTNSPEQLIDVINTTSKPTNIIDNDLERFLTREKKNKQTKKLAQSKVKPKKIKKPTKKYIKPATQASKPIAAKPKHIDTAKKSDLPPKKTAKIVTEPKKTTKAEANNEPKHEIQKAEKKEILVTYTKINENKVDSNEKGFTVDNLLKVNHLNINYAAIQSNIVKYLNFKTISEHFKMKYLFLILTIWALLVIIKYIIKQLKRDADKEFDKTKQANKIINKSKNIYNRQNHQHLENKKEPGPIKNKDIQIDDFIDTVSSTKSGYFTSPISNTQEDEAEKEFKILNKFNKDTPEISFKSVSEKLFADSFNHQLSLNKPSARRPTGSTVSMRRPNKATVTLQKRPINPLDQLIVLEGVQIAEQRGLYVVRLEDKKALVGTIDDKVFVLKMFKESNNSVISIKKTAGKPLNQDVFYVQVGEWKGVVTSNAQKFDLEMSF